MTTSCKYAGRCKNYYLGDPNCTKLTEFIQCDMYRYVDKKFQKEQVRIIPADDPRDFTDDIGLTLRLNAEHTFVPRENI